MGHFKICGALLIFSMMWTAGHAHAQAGFTGKKRIIALSPALTEMIFALHFDKGLVGVSEFSNFPEEAKQITSVGPYTKPSLEKMISLKPDVIFIPQEGPSDLNPRLDQLHLPYKVISMRTLKEIGDAAIEISKEMGAPQAGDDFKQNWEKNLNDVFSKKPVFTPNIFVEVQNSPLMAAGPSTFLDEIVTGCGAKNIVSKPGYPLISRESVVQEKIDIVLMTDNFLYPKDKDDAISSWKSPLKTTPQILAIDPDIVSRPGPRLIDGAKKVCTAIAGFKDSKR